MKTALARLARRQLHDADFDPDFYRLYYRDLQGFKTPSSLHRHYTQHGKVEGRFASLKAAKAHFERLNGPAPADFNVVLYRQLNPDLAKLFSHDVEYELHFLEFGRNEGRPYNGQSGREAEAWEKLLNVYDFNLLNESWLPKGGVDRAEAFVRFEREGLERLAPIARGWVFDPAFYRAQYVLEGDDAELYRNWLHVGLPAGRAPNEVRAIFGLLGGGPYPTAFDWQRYCKLKKIYAAAPHPARVTALESLFAQPVDDAACSCITGDAAGQLYEAIGNHQLIRARYGDAAEAYRQAIATGKSASRVHLRLGDALKAVGDSQNALASFRQALTLPDASIWALIHAATIMMSLRMHRDGMQLVLDESRRFCAHELFDGFVDEIAGTAFRAVSDTMHAMISDDRQDEVLDTYAEGRLSEITTFLRETKISGDPLRLAAKGPRRIVILACLDLAQCTFYRVEQKRRLLEERQIEVEVFDCNDPSPFMTALPGASAAIFYRVPCYPRIVESILYAGHLGIDTFFDIDDLIFTRDFPDSFESYENQISRQDYFGLCHGVALYKHAIGLCDGAIVSTVPLAEKIAPLVAGGSARTFVVPNGFDDRSERAIRYGAAAHPAGDSVSIFYGSGTKAHNRDFSDIVAPALLEVLAAYPRCRLVLVGYLRLDRRFDAFEARISRFPFIGDLDTYWAILASCDINISVLQPGPIADGKSEIKWLEAAMLGLPSIVSATRTYELVLTEGENALLARDGADWLRHLRGLIEDPARRRTIGAHARALALRNYGAPAVAAKLEAAIGARKIVAVATTRGHARKRRLLICNVFFAPQSYGGATRVVEDNIDQLLERYADAFDISIVSSFRGLKTGALRVHNYRGCPVYRIGTPVEVNMDWRPFNDEEVLPAFRRVLEVAQPDLVHFHCVQRLTASIVEETLRADIPYLVTVHDAWWIADHQFLVDQDDRLVDLDDPFQAQLPSGVTRPQALHRLQRLKSLLNAGIKTLAVSRSFADLYRAAGIDNVEVCENGLRDLGPPRAKVTPDDKIVLGHIGGRSAHKGATLIETVLKAHEFHNLELLMIDGTLDTGEEQIELWGTTRVRLRAPVESAHLDQLYSTIDILLAPSIWPESYGLVTREALHYRTWVIASDQGALAQDLIEGVNSFVIDTRNSIGLASALATVDGDVARFKVPLQEATLRRSSRQVDELTAVYTKILDERAKADADRAARPEQPRLQPLRVRRAT